jgi:hypothetical protein
MSLEHRVGCSLFGALLADDLVKKLEKLPAEPRAFSRRGSNVASVVETAGRYLNPRLCSGLCSPSVKGESQSW